MNDKGKDGKFLPGKPVREQPDGARLQRFYADCRPGAAFLKEK